jgi:hypothetical protein
MMTEYMHSNASFIIIYANSNRYVHIHIYKYYILKKDESTIKETSKTLITNYFNITGNNVYKGRRVKKLLQKK